MTIYVLFIYHVFKRAGEKEKEAKYSRGTFDVMSNWLFTVKALVISNEQLNRSLLHLGVYLSVLFSPS